MRNFLRSNNLYFATVHTNKVRAYARAKGGYAKTDKIDSKLLHDYDDKFVLLVKQTYHDENQTKLHALIKRREQLILFKNQEIARLETENNLIILSSLETHIFELTKQLMQIQEHIQDLVNNHPIIKEKINKLISIPRVGITLATTVICELPEAGNIKFTALTALAGLAPYARESGTYKGKRAIFQVEVIYVKCFIWLLLLLFAAINGCGLSMIACLMLTNHLNLLLLLSCVNSCLLSMLLLCIILLGITL